MSLSGKIASIIAVLVLGFALHLIVYVRTTPEKYEDSYYRDVITLKDLLADAAPPPMYAVEFYTLSLEFGASSQGSKAALQAKREQWEKLRSEHKARFTYWNEHLHNAGLRALLDAARASGERVIDIGDREVIPAAEAEDRARLTAALEHMKTAFEQHRRDIDQAMQQTQAQITVAIDDAASNISGHKALLVWLGILVAALGAIAAVFVGRSIAQRSRKMADTLGLVAAGDLTQRVDADSSDELGAIAEQINRTLESLEHTFADVGNVASSVAEAAARLAASSSQISHGAQQQAASLEETAASLEEITATVKQSANSAQQASAAAVTSRDTAERGGSVVSGAISAMDEITKASRRIGDIITTIDEIALQTNLLALNAAVEAARAGEQGRGFAVVASEVGNLAQRSAAAAKEVKTLIQDSLERIQAGHSLVGESGRALNDIIVTVKKVTEIVGDIAAGTREQSIGVDQVNQAVSQMDQVTQSNAAQTDQLSHTAQAMAESAERLKSLVHQYRFSQQPRQPPAHGSDSGAGRRPKLPSAPRVSTQNPANSNAASDDFEVMSTGTGH
jgi:methyl-accepting chemotaxis protein